ncbi:MAG: hypothetical protein ABIH78_03575 [Candidatus Peregrinibacteria bacterium]
MQQHSQPVNVKLTKQTMEEPNTLNIPAYQRKRSLAAKARKTRPTRTRRASPRKVSTLRFAPQPTPFEPPIQSVSLNEVREMKVCGTCDGYFEAIEVAVIKVTSPIRNGDRIIFEKDNGLFEQTVESMQINRKDVSLAHSGSDIGIKVSIKPTVGTLVYKVI